MKQLLSFAIILFSLNVSMMAQKGFEVQKEVIIDVPAEDLWEMVGPGFVEVYKWASNVDHAEGKGMSPFEGAVCDERFCAVNVKGFDNISEKLTNYDDQKMTLSYAVNSGMPGFVTLAQNNWTVVPIGSGKSKLVMNAEFQVKGLMGSMMKGMMEKNMRKTLSVILVDAKTYAETGEVSIAKAERIEELNRKAS